VLLESHQELFQKASLQPASPLHVLVLDPPAPPGAPGRLPELSEALRWFRSGSQVAPRGAPGASQVAPRGSQVAPRCFPGLPDGSQVAPRNPRSFPGGSQELLGATLEPPQGLWEALGSRLGPSGSHLGGSWAPWEPPGSHSGAIWEPQNARGRAGGWQAGAPRGFKICSKTCVCFGIFLRQGFHNFCCYFDDVQSLPKMSQHGLQKPSPRSVGKIRAGKTQEVTQIPKYDQNGSKKVRPHPENL
jgi:hypothetical protein